MTSVRRVDTVQRVSNASLVRPSVRTQVTVLGASLGVMWLCLLLNAVTGGALNVFGVLPRSSIGLRGILFAPFLHASVQHLAANTGPLLVLGWLVLSRGTREFVRVTAVAALASGLAAWLLGAPRSVHIGASGVIFGYFGYLLLRGWYVRRIADMLISVGLITLWGGLALGVLPGTPGVSWQSHLGGFVGGVLAARYGTRSKR